MLREPSVAADGRLQEWWEEFAEPEPGHRHLSHLFAVYPGDEVTPRSTPELAAAARRSLEHRLANGGGGPGWSRAWVAGYGRGCWKGTWPGRACRSSWGLVLRQLLWLSRPGVFQIDANFGATSRHRRNVAPEPPGTLDVLPAFRRRGQMVRCRVFEPEGA